MYNKLNTYNTKLIDEYINYNLTANITIIK